VALRSCHAAVGPSGGIARAKMAGERHFGLVNVPSELFVARGRAGRNSGPGLPTFGFLAPSIKYQRQPPRSCADSALDTQPSAAVCDPARYRTAWHSHWANQGSDNFRDSMFAALILLIRSGNRSERSHTGQYMSTCLGLNAMASQRLHQGLLLSAVHKGYPAPPMTG
jgi:hypothetical protein